MKKILFAIVVIAVLIVGILAFVPPPPPAPAVESQEAPDGAFGRLTRWAGIAVGATGDVLEAMLNSAEEIDERFDVVEADVRQIRDDVSTIRGDVSYIRGWIDGQRDAERQQDAP